MADRSYLSLTDDELDSEFHKWAYRVKNAGGWSSAYHAACELREIVAVGQKRGLPMTNPHPIVGSTFD